MLFRNLPDAVHSADIAVSDKITEKITRKLSFILAKESKDEILSDSCLMDT